MILWMMMKKRKRKNNHLRRNHRRMIQTRKNLRKMTRTSQLSNFG